MEVNFDSAAAKPQSLSTGMSRGRILGSRWVQSWSFDFVTMEIGHHHRDGYEKVFFLDLDNWMLRGPKAILFLLYRMQPILKWADVDPRSSWVFQVQLRL